MPTTCPHCGAEAPNDKKFCPKCARLVDSPLLRMKQELDALRGQPLHMRLASSRAHASPPSLPDMDPSEPVYRVRNAGPSAAFEASHGTPATPSPIERLLGKPERAEQQRGKRRNKERSSAHDAPHSTSGHRFDPSLHNPPQQTHTQTQPRTLKQKAADAAAGPPPERWPRPAATVVLGLLDLFAALALFSVAAQITMANPEPRASIVDMTRYVWGGLALLFLLTALTVWARAPLGRLLQMLVALPMLAVPPIGTFYGLALLFYLSRAGTKALFSGKSPRQLTATQWAAAQTALKLSPVMAVLFFIFALFPAVGLARLLVEYVPQAAVELDRLRAQYQGEAPPAPVEPGPVSAQAADRTAETGAHAGAASGQDAQTTAIDDVRALMRAQAAYASLNGGLYDRVECVVTPSNCIPSGDPRNAARLLEPRFTQMERNGYVFELRLSAPPEARDPTVSKSGMAEYAYRATPAKREMPGYCGDHTGLVCTFDPANAGGDPFKCPAACAPLQ